MKFYFDKKQYLWIVIISALTILLGISINLLVLPQSAAAKYSLFLLIAFCIPLFVRVVSERKTWLAFDEAGVTAFRHGVNYNFKWDEIHRVEFKHSKWLPINRAVIIHGFGKQDVYIDIAMENHKQIYKTLLEYIEKYAPANLCVDQDLYEYVGMEKTDFV